MNNIDFTLFDEEEKFYLLHEETIKKIIDALHSYHRSKNNDLVKLQNKLEKNQKALVPHIGDDDYVPVIRYAVIEREIIDQIIDKLKKYNHELIDAKNNLQDEIERVNSVVKKYDKEQFYATK